MTTRQALSYSRRGRKNYPRKTPKGTPVVSETPAAVAPAAPQPSTRKAFTEADLDRPAAPGAAAIALDRLETVLAARVRLGDPADADALHDFRTELRRLRTILRTYRGPLGRAASRALQRRLRRLARATARARDLEVQLAELALVEPMLRPRDKTGHRWITRGLKRERRDAEARAETRIAGRLPAIAEKLNRRLTERGIEPAQGPTLAQATASRITTVTDRLARRLEATRGPSDQAEAHAARIAGKRIRYLLEPFADTLPAAAALVATLKALQDVLGRMHDAHVLATMVAHSAEAAFEDQLERETARMRDGTPSDEKTLRRERRRDPLPGLREIARRASTMRAEAWDEFEREWLPVREERLLAPLRSLAAALESRAPAGVEIERKYLLTSLPPRAEEVEPLQIEQGYLPGKRIQERLRRVRNGAATEYWRTIKAGRGVTRQEVEEETTEPVFEAMWPLTKGRRLTKLRHPVPDGGFVWEIDAFTDRNLVLAEVELDSETQRPEPPEWLAPYVVREVTGEDEFVNINLAR